MEAKKPTVLGPSVVVSISGPPNSGKSHMALTFEAPIVIFSFDIGGIEPLLPKFAGKEIELKKYPIPIIDSDPPKPYARVVWEQLDEDFRVACEGGKVKTLILDTATAVWEIIRHAVAEQLQQKKLLEVQYTLPNLRMRSLFTRAKVSGVNLVTTQYLADKYVAGENTGEQSVKGWGETEAQADIALWNTMRIEKIAGGKNNVYVESKVVKDRFLREMNGQLLRDATYEDIIALTGI